MAAARCSCPTRPGRAIWSIAPARSRACTKRRSRPTATTSPGQPELASAVDFALEALCAQKKISRSDDWRYSAGENGGGRRQQGRERERAARQESFDDDEQ